MVHHVAQWTTAAPLWADLAGIGLPDGINAAASTDLEPARKVFLRPAILRFTSDEFMEEFMTRLENAPDSLNELRVIRETWRGPASDAPAFEKKPRFVRPLELRRLAAEKASSGKKSGGLTAWLKQPAAATDVFGKVSPALKLYQPAHMRHYLVAANLVCQTTGLPDRMLNTAAQERVGFVVRRLVPQDAKAAALTGDPDPADEYAFVGSGGKWAWTPLGDQQLADGEEHQAMFPVTYQTADGHKRRLFAGVIPVGRREVYMGAARASDLGVASDSNKNFLEPGEQLFVTQVFEPWKRLIETAYAAYNRYIEKSTTDNKAIRDDSTAEENFRRATRDQAQAISWLILLDFSRLLQQYLPGVWDYIISPSPTAKLGDAESKVLSKLQGTRLGTNLRNDLGTAKSKEGLVEALVAICGGSPFDQDKADAVAQKLESAIKAYDSSSPESVAAYPSFLFPLADFLRGDPLPRLASDETIDTNLNDLDSLKEYIEFLRLAVKAALGAQKEQAGAETVSLPQPLGAQPVMNPAEGWFVLRCVMERPECHPLLSPPVVSERSEPFQMAGFFDPDAPARPIRINLPVDTTPAGLRKFDKNAAFVLSDVLCGQVQRAKGLSLGDLVLSVLPWPFHKDLPSPTAGQCTEKGATVGMICTLSIPIITICALILLIIIVTVLDYIFHWLPYLIMCFPLPGLSAKKESS